MVGGRGGVGDPSHPRSFPKCSYRGMRERKGRKEKGREGKGKREGRKEKGREGKKKGGEGEKKKRTQEWPSSGRFFFFLLNNQELILFRGNPLSGQRNPLQGWWCHKTP